MKKLTSVAKLAARTRSASPSARCAASVVSSPPPPAARTSRALRAALSGVQRRSPSKYGAGRATRSALRMNNNNKYITKVS